MKKLFALLLCLLTLLSLAACADSGKQDPAREDGVSDAAELPTLLDQNEYVLYQNIFFNKQADDYIGKTQVKKGTFTRLTDAFSGTTRYYVWGYMDATHCCDWQWEFVPKDPDSLPANGSLVKMTGTVTRDEAALDKIWFTDAEVELIERYSPEACDVDMTTMSGTLERVQLLNMQYKPDCFQGKSLRIYGRIYNLSAIQHPYYDNAWTQDIEFQEDLPAIGTMVIVTGTWKDSTVQASRVEGTSIY